MFFTVKKVLSALLMPYCLGMELLIVGLALLGFTSLQRLGKTVVTAGVSILLLLSLSPVSDALLESLESRYPPVLHQQYGVPHPPIPDQIPWIVVLGGGFDPDKNRPVTSSLGSESLARLTEAVRLYRLLPGSRLILSGGAVHGPLPESEGLSETARIMGVPAQDLLQENRSRDTEEQALRIKPLVGAAPFLLVTSAYHMTRSMAIFQKQGMAPIPAPSAFKSQTRRDSDPFRYFPDPSQLLRSESVIHEYLGLLWYRLSGRL